MAYKGTDGYTHVRKLSLVPGVNFATQISDNVVSGNVSTAPSDLVQLSDGKLAAVWYNSVSVTGQDNTSVIYRILNSDGSINNNFSAQSIDASAILNCISFTVSGGSSNIKAIPTSDGGMAIAIRGGTVIRVNGVSTVNDDVMLFRVSSTGTLSTPIYVGGTGTFGNPDLVQLPNGQLMVIWNSNSGSTASVQYRLVNSDGTLSGSVTSISSLTIPAADALTCTALATLGNGSVLTILNGNYVIMSNAGAAQTTNGTPANDTQMGGDGADTLTGGGGADVILAGAGNDTVVINASNISNLTTAGRLLDGGTGIDTLRIGADASTLDLSKSAIQANVQNFEKIDLGSDAVVNTVILNASAVQRLATQNLDGTSSNKQLIIDGTSSDLVKLSGQWNNGIQAGYWQQSSTTPTRTVGGVTYKVYTISGLSGVEVLVNNAITSANTDLAYPMASGDIITLPNTSVIVGDLETTSTGGSTGSGDGGSQQPANLSSTTSDTSPLVQGTLSQALTGTQVLKLYRTNVTDGGAAVEVSANVTTSGTNWQFQDSGLVAGKQYRYEARIMDGSTLVDASNTYTINEAVSTLPTNAGDDTVVVNADDVTQLGTGGSGALVDGGAGVDTLTLSGASITLDLTNATLSPRVTNFEKFDITGSGANVFKLNASDVLQSNMTVGNATHVVQVDGDSDDIVNLSKLFDNGTAPGTWSTASTTTISGTTYNVYNYSGDSSLQVLIDNQIASSNVTLS